MIFNTDPIFRARVWQGIARVTLGLIAMYNALLGLTEPTSLTARSLGPDPVVDIVQVTQVACAVWILVQAVSHPSRQSAYASIPFSFVTMSFMVQFAFVLTTGILSWLLAAYYVSIAIMFGVAALAAASGASVCQRGTECEN